MNLKYYLVAAALGLGWLGILLVPQWTREWLLGPRENRHFAVALNALYMILTSLILARVFRRFITSARSLWGDLLRALLIPYAGCIIYLTLAILAGWLISLFTGAELRWQDLGLYYWGFLFALGAFYVVVPFGLFSQLVLRRVGNDQLLAASGRLPALVAATALIPLGGLGDTSVRAQDILIRTGITIENPVVRRRPPRPSRSAPRINVALEEALEAGNTARQANPPRYEEAERAYLRAARLAPRDARPFVGRGNISFSQTHYADAVTHYNRALQLNQREAAQAYPLLVISYMALERVDEAEQAARRAIEVAPNHPFSHAALGFVMAMRRKLPEAEAAYRRAVQLSPQNAVFVYQLGGILLLQRRYDEAITHLRQALSLPLDPALLPWAQFSYGAALRTTGQLDQAAEQYRHMLRSAPPPTLAFGARILLGWIYYTKGDFAAARREWQEAEAYRDNLPPPVARDLELARIAQIALDGRLAEARPKLEEHARATNDNDAWLMLGDVLRALGEEEAACAAYVRAAHRSSPELAVMPRPRLSIQETAAQNPPAPATRQPETNLQPDADGTVQFDVLNGRAILLPQPRYPREARQRRIAGMVGVRVVMGEDGRVLSARADSGPQQLYEAAEEAARRARFAPTLIEGRPVRVSGRIFYIFAPQ